MSEWIRVDDRLPTEPTKVQMYIVANDRHKTQAVGHYIRRFQVEVEDDCEDWHETPDDGETFYYPEGWYEQQWSWGDYAYISVTDEVTHWLPLPEPPILQESEK